MVVGDSCWFRHWVWVRVMAVGVGDRCWSGVGPGDSGMCG